MLHQRGAQERRARDLLPAEHPLPAGADEPLHALHEEAVVDGVGRQRLVAPDVQVRPGRQRRDLAEDVVDEGVGLLPPDAERAEAHLDARVRRGGPPVARELAVRRECGVHVSRHVDLGHDIDVALRRVGDETTVVALGVVAAVPAADGGSPADPGQPRSRCDGEAPTLVVGQVEMQAVELVEREEVDQALELADAEEVARDVEHHPSPGEPRPVVDGDDGDLPRARSSPRRLDRIGQELPQRLDAADEPGRRARGERHECRRDRQPVSLLPEGAVTGAEGDDDVAAGGRAGRAHRQPEARGRSEVEGEEAGGAARVGIEGRDHDPRRTRQLERPAPGHDGERLRDDRGKRRRPLSHVPRRT